MKNIITAVLAVCITLSYAIAPLSAASQTLVIEGSTTVLPISQAIAETMMDTNKDLDISVRGGGSGVGITSIAAGTCDIGQSSRPIKDDELQKAAAKGKNIKAHVIAMDGIAVIVNPSNPVSAFSKKQVLDIFTGKISNWKEVGGSDMKIVVVSRDSASGTFEAFGELALNKQKVRADALMQASNQGVAVTITKTPGAIGYVGVGYVTSAVKAVPIDGINVTKQTVLSGKYPYARPLFLYTNGAPTGSAKMFIDFLVSAQGQKIVEEQGFVGLK